MAIREEPSLKSIQTDNGDGSFNIRVADKTSYFNAVAKELQESYPLYSDVRIVSNDGTQFEANKAILSRCKRFSNYLHNGPKDDHIWIIFPESGADAVRQALLWFYDCGSTSSQEQLCALEAVLGANSIEDCDMNAMSCENIELNEGQLKEVVCKINKYTRQISCSFCKFESKKVAQISLHMANVHGLNVHRNKVMKDSQSSNHDDSSDDDISMDSENDETEYPFKCQACNYTSPLKLSLKRHYAIEHFQDKLIDIFALGPDQNICSACNSICKNTKELIIHLADDHYVVKTMIEVEFKKKKELVPCQQESNPIAQPIETTDLLETSKKAFACFLCDKQFEMTINFVRHLAWFHFKSKMLALGASLCQSGHCLPSKSKEIDQVFHLALKHNALKFCMTDEDYKKLELLRRGSESIEPVGNDDVQEYQDATNVLCDQPFSFTPENSSDIRPLLNGKRKLSPSKTVGSKRIAIVQQNGVIQAWVCPECKLLVKKSVEIHQKSCKGHQFSCNICGKSHPTSAKLLYHYANDHFKAELNRKFGLKKTFKVCQFCNINFHNMFLLRNHFVRHHNGLDGCLEKDLIQKLLIDIKENIVCTVCNRAFTTQVSLKKHLENFHMQIQV